MVEEALAVVGLDPSDTLGKYPHQLSGGQRQRLITARAFLLKPRIIVADEPVSMVDASRRAMILEIMLRLKQEFGISFLYITHDLSTAYDVCDDIIILYRGEVVEQGNAQAVISNPQHSYTRLLVDSIPIPDPDIRWKDRLELTQEIDLISNR
jgi:peptide/nickel transport system ATP-binding protein